MLHDEPVCLSSGLGETFLCHLAALFHTPLQQEALVSFEQLQLVRFLQLLLPKQTKNLNEQQEVREDFTFLPIIKSPSPVFDLLVQSLQSFLNLLLFVLQLVAHHGSSCQVI